MQPFPYNDAIERRKGTGHGLLQDLESAAPASDILFSSFNDLYTESTRRKLLASNQVGHLLHHAPLIL